MASPMKNPCLNRGERMDCESSIPLDDSDETDTDEENGGILSTYSGAGLIYFEHSYTKNCVSLCELYENSEFETEKLPVISENLNIQVPVRRSQRQINKSEKEAVSSINVVEATNIEVSPVKSKICNEEKSKENVELSDSNAVKKIIAEAKADQKKKTLKIEIKPINIDIALNSAKPSQKDEVSHNLSPSKVIKKTKISELKAIFEKEQDLVLKHKTNKKELFSGENGEMKKKDDLNSSTVENRRKRAYSEPSKNETYSPPKGVEKDLSKSKRLRTMTKTKSPQKAKKLEKSVSDSSMKKRKRNMSAPSDQNEMLKTDSKVPDTPNKGRRKKCTSLSEAVQNEPVQNEPAKVDIKKRLSVENKGPVSKGPLTPSPSTPVKPKFKKTSRRESLRLVINEDEPPLFSQPDVMVKVKSDDGVTKKEEKVETDEKHLVQGFEVNKTEHPSSGSNSDVQQVESESPKILVKNLDSEVNDKEELPKTNMNTTSDVLDYFDEKDDIKDIDSENSLHIDEGVEKIVEEEYDKCSKNNLTENIVDTLVISDMDKEILRKSFKDYHDNELSNAAMSPSMQSNVDLDSDKPIAERKPRRIIKKKEFFEDITSRTATPTRKSGGKQKGTDKKSSSDEDSKQKRKKATKDEADSDESSEDDPSKLWCICRQPHNDRFMIQCDGCEDWFHGNCVGVTRQQGRKLEKQQKEWKCPNCLSKESEVPKTENVVVKKIEERKIIAVEKKDVKEEKIPNSNSLPKKDKVTDKTGKIPAKSPVEKTVPTSIASKNDSMPVAPLPMIKKSFNKNAIRNATKGNDASLNNKKGIKEPVRRKQNCIVCHAAATANSCYCSEKCLEKHVANSLAIMGEGKGALKGSDFDAQKVVVLDRVKGSVIAGDNAPSAGNVLSWIKANPSFMIACSPSSSTSLRKETVAQKKEDSASASKEKKETSEESSNSNVRFNVRKTLKNILMDRCKNADDIQLPEEEIRKIAVKIEEELHSLFKDNSLKYKSKYRSLMFNIKDPRNQGLFRKILKGNIPPDKLVRMSPEELASMELAKWREQENQHLLDMIKRVQLEQQSGSGLLLKKTHKGEVEIEDDFTNIIDDIPKASSKPFSVSGEPTEVEKPEPDKEVAKDTTHLHRSHLFDLNCKICTGKILPPPVEDNAQKKVRVAHSISVDLSSPASIDPVEKTISRIVDGKSPLSSTGDDSLDQEPTSTVSIGSPEAPVKYTYESDSFSKVTSSVWKGFIYMQDVAKFVTCAYKVSGQTEYLHMDVPDTIQVCGRIIPDQVWEYLGKIKQSGNKELIIVRFQAANQEEAATYNSFYSYLSTRKRYGVVSNYSKKVKDFYILPLAATSPVPIVLMPFDGPGLPSPRPHLLLGVIVRHKIKQTGIPLSKKEKGKEEYDKLDGSFTPPLDTRSYTPPLPALQTDISPDTAYSPSIDFKSTISSEESDITQNSIASCTDIPSKNDSDIYEPSYTPPLQILSSDSPRDRDDDKPYDPEQDILNIESEARDPKLSPRENIDKYVASENLEKHKKILDALTRQVEETDRQVNALKQMISHPDDSDAEFHSPSNQSLDINSVTASGMSSFLDLPENLQDLLNVVRDKTKVPSNREDVDMRISNLFGKSFSSSVDKFSSFQGLSESDKISSPQEKNVSRGATPPVDDPEEVSPAVVRPSDPRIKLRTSFQDQTFSSEEPANVSLSNMSVTELVERAEKELADIDAVEKAQSNSQSGSSQEKVVTTSIDKMSSSWSQFKEPPPPGIELSDLTSQESSFSSKSVSSSSTSDNSLPSSFTSPLVQDSPLIVPPFPPPALPSTFPPLPPGFSVQTPPPNIKNFPPPNVISTSFPPPPLPIASKSSDGNSASETWPSWNIPPQQSKDNGWQNRVPQWDENWKNAHDTVPVESPESSSHYYPPASHEFRKEQFFRAESSSESRWSNRSSPRFGRNNWHKRPNQGGKWRGRRSFHFNKNQRN